MRSSLRRASLLSRGHPRSISAHRYPGRALSFCFAVAAWVFLVSLAARVTEAAAKDAESAVSTTPQLLVLSTVDGGVLGLDAETGKRVFALPPTATGPAVSSWAAPGQPRYIPGLNGLLYRLRADRPPVEVDGVFLGPGREGSGGRGAVAQFGSVQEGDGGGVSVPAVVLKHTHTSVTYVDAKTGAIVRELDFETPANPGAVSGSVGAGGQGEGTGVIVLSRTSVSVRVVDAVSNAELANASITHTSPSVIDGNVCMPAAILDGGGVGSSRAFRSLVDVERGVVTMVTEGGSILWTTVVDSDIIDAHGLGDVAVERAFTAPELDVQNTGVAEKPGEPSGRRGGVSVRGVGTSRYALAGPNPGPAPKNAASGRARSRALAKLFWMDGPSEDDDLIDFETYADDEHMEKGNVRQRAMARMMPGGGSLGPEVLNMVFMLMGVCVAFGVAIALVGLAIMRRFRLRRREKGEEASSSVTEGDANGERARTSRQKSGLSSPVRRPPKGNFPHLSTDIVAIEADASNGSAASSGGSNQVVPVRSESGWLTIGSFEVSANVLGIGSHGTTVYEGRMMPGDRKVAVKRLLRQFYDSAKQEISLLVELDEASPHVVRYFAMEEDPEFIYLALELCQGALSDRVQKHEIPAPPKSYASGPLPRVTRRALRQLMQGLVDLHQQGIVHRDLKPQNVLCQGANLKLADVGLALRLDADRSSFTAVPNGAGGIGTTGWRAPEVLNGERQTRAVDIFAAGCIISYVVTNGDHPFGSEVFGRDRNISKDEPDLRSLAALQSPEAYDVVKQMLSRNPKERPSAAKALQQPFFWTDATKLAFLVDISDRLYDLRNDSMRYTELLDESKLAVQWCSDWPRQMDPELMREVGPGYISSASNLLRVVRNKRNHYSELSPRIQKLLGPLPDDDEKHLSLDGGETLADKRLPDEHNFLTYFLRRVPHLFMCVYGHALNYPVLVHQPHFTRYGFDCSTTEHDVLRVHPMVSNLRSVRSDDADEQLACVRSRPSEDVGEASEAALLFKASLSRPGPRMYYGRGQLVALGEAEFPMTAASSDIAKKLDVHNPSAGERWRRCLATGIYDPPTSAMAYDSDGADSDVGGTDLASMHSSPAPGTPTMSLGKGPVFEMAGVPFMLSPTGAKPPPAPPAPPPGFESSGFGRGRRRPVSGVGGFGSAPSGSGSGLRGPGFGRGVRIPGQVGQHVPQPQAEQQIPQGSSPQNQYDRKPKLGFTAPGDEERRDWGDLRRTGGS